MIVSFSELKVEKYEENDTVYDPLSIFRFFFLWVSLLKVKHPLIFPFVSNNPSFKSSRKKKMKSALVVFLSSVYVVSASESTPGCLLRDGDVAAKVRVPNSL